MLFELCAAVAFGLVVLYVPGYFAARAFSLGRFASVAIAPVFSACALTIIGVVLAAAGITCKAYILAAICLALGLIIWAISWAIRRMRSSGSSGKMERVPHLHIDASARPWLTAAIYIVIALAVTAVVFGTVLDTADAFSRKDDTTAHLSFIRSFLKTGTFSTLNVSAFLDQGLDAKFYPAQWHVVTAVIASVFGDNVALASNALIIVFLVFVFPLAMCLFFFMLFPESKRARYAGALFVLAFSAFPWGFLVFGQLLPNMMAFSFVPAVMSVLIEATETERKTTIAKLVFLVAVGFIAIALAQPNGVFTLGLWMGIYLVHRVFFEPGAEKAIVDKKRVGLALGLVAIICIVWVAMYLAPFMQSVVQNTWKAFLSPFEGLFSALSFMFTERAGIHPFLSVAVLIGVIYACRHRRYLWMVIACALAMVFYYIGATTDGPVKHLLTGFWYTDYYRTAAMTSLFAIPLAALGFVSMFNALQKLFTRKSGEAGTSRTRAIVLPAAILLVVFGVCQFFPFGIPYRDNTEIRMGLIKIHKRLNSDYSWNKVLTLEEVDFIDRASELIPEDALIINVPSDGSAWVYGIEGTNLFFRRSKDTGMADDKTCEVIRLHLKDASSNEEVQKILEDYDAHYVLLLDVKSGENRTVTSHRYKEENWVGIESIDENTPGFTLLLSDGDMRFYHIDAIEDANADAAASAA